MSFEFSIIVVFIGLVIGFIIKQITGVDLVKLAEVFGVISFLLPLLFAIPVIVNNPTPTIIENFITIYINNLVSFIVGGIPGMIAGAIFDAIIGRR